VLLFDYLYVDVSLFIRCGSCLLMVLFVLVFWVWFGVCVVVVLLGCWVCGVFVWYSSCCVVLLVGLWFIVSWGTWFVFAWVGVLV